MNTVPKHVARNTLHSKMNFIICLCYSSVWIQIHPEPNYFAGSEIETRIRILA